MKTAAYWLKYSIAPLAFWGRDNRRSNRYPLTTFSSVPELFRGVP